MALSVLFGFRLSVDSDDRQHYPMTTVGWVPIEDVQFESTTITTSTSRASSVMSKTSTKGMMDYSTTSYQEAQIQYRPLRGEVREAEGVAEVEDVPMSVIDIESPDDKKIHIVTWLDPTELRLDPVFDITVRFKVNFNDIRLAFYPFFGILFIIS